MVGIVSYGTYIPEYRIKTDDIARAWGKIGENVSRGLGVFEKVVPGIDEDAVTLAVSAATDCFAKTVIEPKDIGVLLVGSESHPYAVNPTSTIVGEFLGVGNKYLAADLEFACKAGTAGMQAIAGLVSSGHVSYGLAIGTDTAQSKPHDVLEYTSGAGSAAFLLGKTDLIAELVDFVSYSSDTPDFWRRDGVRYPTHAGRFSGEPAYFTHVAGAALELMKKTGIEPAQINHSVFHSPNGKFPQDIARRLGFSKEQMSAGFVVPDMGNPYSASAMISLSAVLDVAKAGDLIFMVSYGSGAGSDAFLWKATTEISNFKNQISKKNNTVREQLAKKTYIDYTKYLQMTHKI